MLIGDKPLQISVLEDEQGELNENLISAQILASQLDRVFTLFQENLALSQMDSLAEDASLPFLKFRVRVPSGSPSLLRCCV